MAERLKSVSGLWGGPVFYIEPISHLQIIIVMR